MHRSATFSLLLSRPMRWLPACIWLTMAAAPALAQQPKPAPQAAAAPAADADDDLLLDPAVRTVLESNPQSPAELLRSVVLLVELGEPKLALPLLKKLTDANLDVETLADLAEQAGTPAIMRLGLAPELGVPAAKLADALIAAANKRVRDPAHLAAALAKLNDPALDVRRSAVFTLIRAREAGVAALLGALADETQASSHDAVESALVDMGRTALPLLLGAMETQNDAFKTRVVNVLGRLAARRALPLLVAPAVSAGSPRLREAALAAIAPLAANQPTRAEAAAVLHHEIRRYLDRMPPRASDEEGLIELWHWDEGKQACLPHAYRPQDAAMVFAARFSADLHALQSENHSYTLLWLATGLEAARLRSGLDRPLSREPGTAYANCHAAGVETVEDVLRFAMEQRYLAAATDAAEILGEIGTARLVLSDSAAPTPLVRAAGHSDRRLRFAALTSIVKLDPPSPYAGSSAVSDALGWFAGFGGVRRALVAHPRAAAGQNLAAQLGQLGYEADVAYTGRQLIQTIMHGPDVELVLVHSSITGPDLREVVYELRRDERTGGVPLGVMATLDQIARAQRIAQEDRLAAAFPPPADADALRSQIEQFHERDPRCVMPQELRIGQAQQALQWSAELAARPRSFYHLRRQQDAFERALYVPGLTGAAAEVLAAVGGADGQRALADMASNPAIPIEAREAAAKAFVHGTRRHGILLTTEEILRQYDRYNASETADPASQQVLASILDALEAPTKPLATRPDAPREDTP